MPITAISNAIRLKKDKGHREYENIEKIMPRTARKKNNVVNRI